MTIEIGLKTFNSIFSFRFAPKTISSMVKCYSRFVFLKKRKNNVTTNNSNNNKINGYANLMFLHIFYSFALRKDTEKNISDRIRGCPIYMAISKFSTIIYSHHIIFMCVCLLCSVSVVGIKTFFYTHTRNKKCETHSCLMDVCRGNSKLL